MRTTWAAVAPDDAGFPDPEGTVVVGAVGASDGVNEGAVTGTEAGMPVVAGTVAGTIGGADGVGSGTAGATVVGGALVAVTAGGPVELTTFPAVTGSKVASKVGVPSGSSTMSATPAVASFDSWKDKIWPSALRTPLTWPIEQSPEGRESQAPGPGPRLQLEVVGQATIPVATALAGWAELTWRARTGLT